MINGGAAMKYDVNNIEEYIEALPEDRKIVINKIREILLENLPNEFEEVYQYGMISYVVPLSRYPKGYLNRENEPLPFISMASQKKHIAIYHMGIYGDEELLTWVEETYKECSDQSLDMGKSCLRFKDINNIPYAFIKILARKMSVDDFIKQVESNIR